MIQFDDDPTLCPFDRTREGNTSAIYTQITDPCEIAKNTINSMKHHLSNPWCAFVTNTHATPDSATIMTTDAISISVFRPSLLIKLIPRNVARGFTSPMPTTDSRYTDK
jgi:hypothetical protein